MGDGFRIADRVLAEGRPPLIIAEIGNNHDGNLDQALRLIDAAAAAGTDAVKFQTYNPDRLVRPDHELYNFFVRYALPLEWHEQLRNAATSAGMIFLSTPFDVDSADFLVSLGVPALKIASSDLTNLPLLQHCAGRRLPLLISTGMGDFGEIEVALSTARESGCSEIALLHCVSVYPTPPEKTDLKAISALKERYGLPVGFSDHSLSTTIPVAAVALGACIIEKHFTLDCSLPGPDHAVALEPDQFSAMAEGCREAAAAMGDGRKVVNDTLKAVRNQSHRGLHAAVDIHPGQVITSEMVALLRPATKLSVADLPLLVGRKAVRDIRAGEELTLELLEEMEE